VFAFKTEYAMLLRPIHKRSMLSDKCHPIVGCLPMSTLTPARDSSRLKRIAELWPYILIALSIVGLALKLYRGAL
jgi:hypothetical protein